MKIGLTYTGSQHKHQNYINWLKGSDDTGDSIEIVTLSAEMENANALQECNGLVLSGGIDSNPKYYNGSEDYPNKPEGGWNTARDEFEQLLYHGAIKKSIPILAVCRGFQLVNILNGGDLVQDLGTLNATHKAEQEIDKAHPLTVFENTLLREIVNIPEGTINSAHHQAINNVADALLINCKAADGTVEGAEWKDKEDKPFLLCVQWHPERMYKYQLESTPLSRNIRNRFIEEVKKNYSKI